MTAATNGDTRTDTEPSGEAKFVIVWQQQEGTWKMKPVISYRSGAIAK